MELGVTKPGGMYPGFFNLRPGPLGQGYVLSIREQAGIKLAEGSGNDPSFTYAVEGKRASLPVTLEELTLLRDHLNRILG